MFTADDIAAWEQSCELLFDAQEYEAWLDYIEQTMPAFEC